MWVGLVVVYIGARIVTSHWVEWYEWMDVCHKSDENKNLLLMKMWVCLVNQLLGSNKCFKKRLQI